MRMPRIKNIKNLIFVGLLIILTVAAFFTRFYHLSHPAAVVFDEIYFAQFSSKYLTGDSFFDIHPPHGKLILAVALRFFNISSNTDWGAISKSNGFLEPNIAFAIRFLPALFGSLLIPLVFILVFVISRSKLAAFLAATFFLLDNALLVQSRFCLMDVFLIFFALLAILFFFLAKQAQGKKMWMFWVLCGIFLGMSAGIKITGLAVIGVIFLFEIIEIIIKIFKRAEIKIGQKIAVFLCISLLPFLVYFGGFLVHFKLIRNSYGPHIRDIPVGFLGTNISMLTANYNIAQQHPFQSKWFLWPFGKKEVYYWRKNDGSQNIWLAGNEPLWRASLMAVLIGCVFLTGFLKKILGTIKNKNLIAFFLLLYFSWWLPLAFIKRPLFLYHYLPSLSFSFILLALLLDEIKIKKIKYVLITAIMVLAILDFLINLPITYGL